MALGQQRQVLTFAERAALDAKIRADAEREARAVREEQVLYLTLLSQQGPVSEVSQPVNGDNIEAYYTPLYKNNTNNPVRVQVFADFTNPGVGVVLSTSSDASDNGKVDELSLTANGKTESVFVILLPTYSLWVRDRDAAFFPMQGNDIVRVRIFDPAKLVAYGNLYPRRGA
jgi:hypothetical protein